MENIGISNLRDMHPFDLSGGQKQIIGIRKSFTDKTAIVVIR